MPIAGFGVGVTVASGPSFDDPDFEWLMIDASYIKVHPHGAGARSSNQAMGR